VISPAGKIYIHLVPYSPILILNFVHWSAITYIVKGTVGM
jgi:hypothetical protein